MTITEAIKTAVQDEIEMVLREFGLKGTDAEVADVYVAATSHVTEGRRRPAYRILAKRSALDSAISTLRHEIAAAVRNDEIKAETAEAFHPGHLTPAQVGQAFAERVAEAKRRVAARTETIVATDIAAPEIVARMMAEQEAPTVTHRCADAENTAADFAMVRESGGRAHIEAVAGTAALCGEPAVVIVGALDLALVDCLVCLDRFAAATRRFPNLLSTW